MPAAAVAITGMGLVSALGRGVAACWGAVATGRVGVAERPELEGPPFARLTGRVTDVTLPAALSAALAKEEKYLNRGGRLAVIAAAEAVAEAALETAGPPDRRALYVATGDLSMVGYEFLYEATRAAAGVRPDEVDAATLNTVTMDTARPFFLLESLNNNPFSCLAAAFSCMGPGTCLASHSPGGSQALELGVRAVRSGRADAALVVASGSWVGEVPLVELHGLGLLSRGRRGAASFCPFDHRRDGFLAGEGGAAVVLEPADSAARRGARILGLVEGGASHTAPRGSSGVPPRVVLRAMELALEDAGRGVAELGFVCPHGSGTRQGDRSEAESILALLGERAGTTPVAALKPYTGHMGAASDLGEVILGVTAASRSLVPGTPGFTRSEAALRGLGVSAEPRRCAEPRVLSASYGLGGQASAVVVVAALGGSRGA